MKNRYKEENNYKLIELKDVMLFISKRKKINQFNQMYAGSVKDGKKLDFNGFQEFLEIQMLDQFIYIWNMININLDIWEKWITIINSIIKE